MMDRHDLVGYCALALIALAWMLSVYLRRQTKKPPARWIPKAGDTVTFRHLDDSDRPAKVLDVRPDGALDLAVEGGSAPFYCIYDAYPPIPYTWRKPA